MGRRLALQSRQTHAPRLPDIATPQNESLAYSLAFVLVIWLLKLVLYVTPVFVKVSSEADFSLCVTTLRPK